MTPAVRLSLACTAFISAFAHAVVTGDDTFRHWKLGGLSLWMDSNVDVPRMVYRHALVCEYAHARLVKLAGGEYPRETSAAFD